MSYIISAPDAPPVAPSNHRHPAVGASLTETKFLFALLPYMPSVWQKSWVKLSYMFEAPQIYQELLCLCTVSYVQKILNTAVN